MVRKGELGGLSNKPMIIYDSLNHGCGVAKLVSRCLATALRILMARRVVGDNHVFISDFLERRIFRWLSVKVIDTTSIGSALLQK